MAERVGVFEAVFENPNEHGCFQRNARGVYDLAVSDSRRRSRVFASVCRFCQRDVTRNVTRPGALSQNCGRLFSTRSRTS